MVRQFHIKAMFFFLAVLAGFVSPARAQYYYQDIYGTRQTNEELQGYARLGLRQMTIRSFDARHTLQDNFRCERQFMPGYRQVITHTAAAVAGASVTRSFFDDQGRVTMSVDSSARSLNTTRYHYDAEGRPDTLYFVARSAGGSDSLTLEEVHIYQYGPGGAPLRMNRLRQGLPPASVVFETDSAGRVSKESPEGGSGAQPAYYYHHDAQGRLTDVFHYDRRNGKMQPDLLFDYDDQGRLKEKTTVTMNTGGYLLWEYRYDSKGLIAGQTCYGKSHALQGSLEYNYSF